MLRCHPDRDWEMVFVGDGYLESKIRSLNDPKIEVLGTLTMAGVQEQMARAWGMVLPSQADTSPNVVKEARVIGLPVVVSPHGGHAEYVESGLDGYLVESGEADDWFRAIDDLCSDYACCKQMGDVRHGFFKKHFRSESTAKKFVELYKKISLEGGRKNMNGFV